MTIVPHEICGSQPEFPNGTIDGYQKLTDSTIVPEFVVAGLIGPVDIPLSILRSWQNDFGKRGYGGAKYVSIFEKGGNETTPGSLITTVNQQPIGDVGVFEVLSVDVERRYQVVVRLRSEINDVNYRDFEFEFYLHTQQGAPTRVILLDDADFPEIEFESVNQQFSWASEPSSDIDEIWLRTGQGRASLPISPTPWTDDFGAEAKDHILRLYQQGGGYFAIDFVQNNISTNTRVFYEVEALDGDPSIAVSKRKRADLSIPGYDNAAIPADFSIDVDRDAGTAELIIDSVDPATANLRYETVSVAGSKGVIALNPASVKYGGTFDISSVFDFTAIEYSPRIKYLDDRVWVMLVTDSKVTVYELTVNEVQPRVISRSNDPVFNPPTSALVMRHMCVGGPGRYIRVENTAAYTNPPLLSNITITEIDTAASVTYATQALFFAALAPQNFGVEGVLSDCLDTFTAGILVGLIGLNHSGWTVQYDLFDGVTTQTITQYIPARFGVAPSVTSTTSMSQANLILARMDPWPNMTFQQIAFGIDNLTLRGDLGTYDFTGPQITALGAGDVTIDVKDYVSREASSFTLEYQVTAGELVIVHLPRYPELVTVSGNPAYTVDPIFTEDALIFPNGSLAGKMDTTQNVTVYGDIGSQVILAPIVENSMYNIYWGGLISSSVTVPYIELEYTDVAAGTVRIRVPNRLGNTRQLTHKPLIDAPKGGWGLSGLYARDLQARLPAAKIDVATQEIIFDTRIGGGMRYDSVAVFNPRSARWSYITKDQVRPLQGGYLYQLGTSEAALQNGDHVYVVFRHETGTQGSAIYKVDGDYHDAIRAEHLQGLF